MDLGLNAAETSYEVFTAVDSVHKTVTANEMGKMMKQKKKDAVEDDEFLFSKLLHASTSELKRMFVSISFKYLALQPKSLQIKNRLINRRKSISTTNFAPERNPKQ